MYAINRVFFIFRPLQDGSGRRGVPGERNQNYFFQEKKIKHTFSATLFQEDIAWLDLSFNDIETVSEDILEFPALKVTCK